MNQARSPSARTEEWTFQRNGKHASRGEAIMLPKGEASTLPEGTANGLPEGRQSHFPGNSK